MGIKYSIKDIVLENDGSYDVTIGANKDNKGDMIFMINLPALAANSIDVESIARVGLLLFKSGISLTTMKTATYQFTVN